MSDYYLFIYFPKSSSLVTIVVHTLLMAIALASLPKVTAWTRERSRFKPVTNHAMKVSPAPETSNIFCAAVHRCRYLPSLVMS